MVFNLTTNSPPPGIGPTSLVFTIAPSSMMDETTRHHEALTQILGHPHKYLMFNYEIVVST